MSKSKVLILSSLDDMHVNYVGDQLTEMSCAFELFRFNDFNNNADFAFRRGANQEDKITLRNNGKQIDLRRYSFIWFRRPGKFTVPPLVKPWMQQMVHRESQATLLGTFFSLECNWMNFPANDTNCQYKLWQLETASRLGFKIPDTLITNSPQEVLDFYDMCAGEVIYKMISETSSSFIPRSERPAGISTMPLRKKDLPFINQVALAPHCFQRKIEKSYELRVTVVGHRIFSIKIDSQSSDKSKVDWRHDYDVPMTPYTLPNELAALCLRITAELGLNYGAIDLVRATTGEYIFIEINSAGQFLWIEEKTGLPVSQAVAGVLSGNEAPLIDQSLTGRNSRSTSADLVG